MHRESTVRARIDHSSLWSNLLDPSGFRDRLRGDFPGGIGSLLRCQIVAVQGKSPRRADLGQDGPKLTHFPICRIAESQEVSPPMSSSPLRTWSRCLTF